MSAKDDVLAGVPDTPARRQMAWLLGMIAAEGAGARLSDGNRYAPSLHEGLAGLQDDAAWQENFRRYASRLGAPVEVSIERSSDHEIAVLLATAKGSKWIISLTVEPDPPHRILATRTDRKHDFKLDVRDATEPTERCLTSQNGAGTTLKGPRGYIAFRFCMTGSDGVDAYLARRQFERQSPGQRFNGAFRRRI